MRTTEELTELIGYVENNPVQAGLVESAAQWPWSSGSRPAEDILLEAGSKKQGAVQAAGPAESESAGKIAFPTNNAFS